MKLEKAIQSFVDERKPYYKQWMYDEPIVISNARFERLSRVQVIMNKLINEFVCNYSTYKHLMPVEKETERILNHFQSKPYTIGTYRTDFVFDKNNQEKLIEITCRFALNGIFISFLMEDVALDYLKNGHQIETIHPQKKILNHLKSYLNNSNKIVLLKGSDKKNESKIFVPIFEKAGYDLQEIHYKDLPSNHQLISDGLIISELTFDEILSLNDKTLELLSNSNLLNDFRTIILIHDKRFFAVISDLNLQERALTKEERIFFSDFHIPTYCFNEQTKNLWENAKSNKNDWIIKHRSLGKSQQIYAGNVLSQTEWEDLFSNEAILSEMVLQRWVSQKTIKGRIGDLEFEDYITGTLLFFDDNYFGFGDFRTSSFPVINKKDHRKATSIILKNDLCLNGLKQSIKYY